MIITRDTCKLEPEYTKACGWDFIPCGTASVSAMVNMGNLDACVAINDENDHVVVSVTPAFSIPEIDGCREEFPHFSLRPSDFVSGLEDDRYADVFMHAPTGELVVVRTAPKDLQAVEATISEIVGFFEEVGIEGYYDFLRRKIDNEKLDSQFAPPLSAFDDFPF